MDDPQKFCPLCEQTDFEREKARRLKCVHCERYVCKNCSSIEDHQRKCRECGASSSPASPAEKPAAPLKQLEFGSPKSTERADPGKVKPLQRSGSVANIMLSGGLQNEFRFVADPDTVSVSVMSCLGHSKLSEFKFDEKLQLFGLYNDDPKTPPLVITRERPLRDKSVTIFQEMNADLKRDISEGWEGSHEFIWGPSSSTKGGNAVAVSLECFDVIDRGTISNDNIAAHAAMVRDERLRNDGDLGDITNKYWESQYSVPLALCRHKRTGVMILFASFHVPGVSSAKKACNQMNLDLLSLLLRVIRKGAFLENSTSCADALVFWAGDGNFQYIKSLSELRNKYNLQVADLSDAMGVYAGRWNDHPDIQEVTPPSELRDVIVNGDLNVQQFPFNDHSGLLAVWRFVQQGRKGRQKHA